MISKIIEFSVRNRHPVIIAWVGIAIWGLYAVLHTPVDAIPDLSENQVIVFADWMGRSPQDIEDQVTYKLSVQLQGLAGVKAVRASSEFNFSMINVIFDEHTDFYFARQRVLERLATAQTQMPAGVVPYMAPDATALGQIFWYTVEGEGKSLDELRAIQDFNVKYQLGSVPGVSEVASVGGMVREYQVDVDPARLRAFDLSLGQVYSAIQNSNMSLGGKIVVDNSAEYLVRGTGWLKGVSDLENVVITSREGVPLFLKNVAVVQMGPAFRRSALEKNGREAVGGVVMMRYGENPLQVTQAIKEKIRDLQAGLPAGVRVVPFYDRTHLIEAAIHTVTGTLREEIIIACIAILLILTHFRSAFVVCITLPMAVLVSFLFMYYLGLPSNIMSLCGIAISIGILVDASVVMVENASHELRAHFAAPRIGNRQSATGNSSPRVTGDTTEIVVNACRLVGRPIFFSVIIMLVSFLPVFALTGQEGKLSHPLVFTKSFAMVGVAVLAITLVPALIPIFVRGRIRSEEENWIVRSFINIYKPMLSFVIDRPAIVWWIMAVILAIGAALINFRPITLIALALGLGMTIVGIRRDGWTMWLVIGLVILVFFVVAARMDVSRYNLWLPTPWIGLAGSWFSWHFGVSWHLLFAGHLLMLAFFVLGILGVIMKHSRAAAVSTFLAVSCFANASLIKPGSEFMPDLNEGSILDMPTSAPRIAMGQAVDDIMVRDRILRSFPEVSMVVGKIGRADTATDPSPLDMVETIITLHPDEWWPKRKITFDDALAQAGVVAAALQRAGDLHVDAISPDDWPDVVHAVHDADFLARNPRYTVGTDILNTAVAVTLGKFDAAMRDLARQRQREYAPTLASALVETAYRDLVEHLGALPVRDGQPALLRAPTADEIAAILKAASPHGLLLVEVVRPEEVDHLLATLRADLVSRHIATNRDDFLLDAPSFVRTSANYLRRAIGSEPHDLSARITTHIEAKLDELWRARTKTLNWELADRAAPLINQLLLDNILAAAKTTPLESHAESSGNLPAPENSEFRIQNSEFAKRLLLWPKTKDDILKEMDAELQVPGWGNAWTQPIINRVNMLATGVRTQIGIKVFGPTGKPLDESIADIQRVSEEIAAKLKAVPGAVDVIPDQAVGKRYLEITIDREKAARYGVNMADISQAVEIALGGGQVTTTIEGRQRFPVRLRYTRDNWQNIDTIKNTLIAAQMTPPQLLSLSAAGGGGVKPATPAAPRPTGVPGAGGMSSGGSAMSAGATPTPMSGASAAAGPNSLELPPPGSASVQIPLSFVADIRIVEGPSMIKSENGRLRNYVTLNVRGGEGGGGGRDLLGFVEEARQAIKPIEASLAGTGMSIEWSGEYEAQIRTNQTMTVVLPLAIVIIFLLLYITFHSFIDSLVAILAVLGAFSGAVMFQAVFGFNRSVVVWIAYVSVIGMATQTAVIMLVYLREAVHRKGGLAAIVSLEDLRRCVIDGAVHRLRPKLLTEGVAIVGLVPMLWATGTGAEIMRPMAAPVLGGLLISDEVIDLMIPTLFYLRRRHQWRKLHPRAPSLAPP